VGGACNAGQCAPHKIADTPGGAAWYIAVDDTHVYWASIPTVLAPMSTPGDGHVRKVPKLGGAVTELSTLPVSFDLVLVKDDVYFTTNKDLNGIRRVPKAGGVEPIIVYNARATDIIARGDRIFFSGLGIWELQASNTGIKLSDSQTEVGKNEEGLTADSDNLWWILHAGPNGSVNRLALSDPTEKAALVNPAKGARRLASDNDAIYWISESLNEGIWRLPKNGGAAQNISRVTMRYGTVIIDGPFAYATADADINGTVYRMNKADGSGAIALASNLKSPVGLAQDDRAIYFTERVTGAIWRMTK